MMRTRCLPALLLLLLLPAAHADDAETRAEAIRQLMVTDLSTKLETAGPLRVITATNDAQAVTTLKKIIQRQNDRLKQIDRKLRSVENQLAAAWKKMWPLRMRLQRLQLQGKATEYNRLVPTYNRMAAGYREIIARFVKQARAVKYLYLAFLDTSDALQKLSSTEAVVQLEAGSKLNWGMRVRRAFILALGKIAKPRSLPLLLGLIDDKDARVRAMAMLALGGYADLSTHREKLLSKADSTVENSWQVRLFLYRILVKGPTQEVIPLLIGKMKSERGRLPHAIGRLLARRTKITTHPGPAAWQRWYAKHSKEIATGKVPPGLPGEKGGSVALYHKIEIHSDNLGFVLDLSGSMTQRATRVDRLQQATITRYGLQKNLLGQAQSELINTLGQVPPKASVDVVVYDDFARHLTREPVKMSKSRRGSLVRKISGLDPGGKTNIYDAFDMIFRQYLDSHSDRAFLQVPDTVFFLTDGKPTRGRIQDRETLALCIDRWRMICPVQIHAIGMGAGAATDLLKKLASSSGGKYRK